MGLWCGIKLAPGSLCEKRSCPVFPVIWPSNYPDQGQQPRLKPYSCLEVELCTRGTADSHALFLFPRSAPSPQSTRELAKAPFPGRWVVRARFHAQAQLSPLLCRARGKTAAARDNRAWWDRLSAGTKDVGLQEQGREAHCHEWGWPMNNSLSWLNRLKASVQMFSIIV